MFLKLVIKLMQLLFQKVKVSRVLSRDMDSIQVLRHMVLNTIVMQDQTVWHLTHPR